MMRETWRVTGLGWFKFDLVGGIRIAVHLLILAVLKTGLGVDYRVATGLAVQGAVVHNFLWHERFTWPERSSADRGAQEAGTASLNLI
jgi:putative flippase GtrA